MTTTAPAASVRTSAPPVAGAVLGIIGSAGAFAGNLLHPDVPDDPAAAAAAIAGSAVWVPAHLLIAVSLVLMTFGLLAVAGALQDGPAGGITGSASAAAVIGVTVGIVLMAADGISARGAALAVVEADAATRPLALASSAFAERIAFGLVAMFNITFGGLPFLLLGAAALRDGRLPRWPGGVIALVGLASIAIGVVQASLGGSPESIELATIVTPVLLTVWTAAMCALLVARCSPPAHT